MKRRSIYNIVFTVFAVIFIIMVVSVYLSLQQQRQDVIKSAIEEKIKLAETIKETIASPSWLYQKSILGEELGNAFIGGLAKFKDIYFIRIIQLGGQISQSNLAGENGKKIIEPAINNVIQSKKILVRSDSFGRELIQTIIYPAYANQAIWIGFSPKETQMVMQRLSWRYLLIALASLLLISLTFYVILRGIVNPIKRITDVCRNVRRGDLEVKIQDQSLDTEIGELAETFDGMLSELRDSRRELEDAKEVLEIKVAARTKELEVLAQGLGTQVDERTKDLREKMEQLERINRLAVGRELKMIELKKEIKAFKEKPYVFKR